ncbi:MAG TPA: shikimate kinase [Candidatus Hydrogenedentes bacterium]|nr:shikimate kinase [Candidatus Hydrogenedentota bacterium]
MAGVGKSTVGVFLAKALHRNFVDTDLVVQSAEGRRLQEIVDELGKEAFQAIEERHVLSIQIPGAVIATGGSVVYSENAMGHLKRTATTVYLKLPLDQLKARVVNTESRGLAMDSGQSFADLYGERLPLYERYTDVTIDCDGLNHDEVVATAVTRLLDRSQSYRR